MTDSDLGMEETSVAHKLLSLFSSLDTLVLFWQAASDHAVISLFWPLRTVSPLVSHYFGLSTGIHGAISKCHLPNPFCTHAAPSHHTSTSVLPCQGLCSHSGSPNPNPSLWELCIAVTVAVLTLTL